MYFGVGYHPTHLTIYEDNYNDHKVVVNTKKEALEIVRALKNYFALRLNEDPMTQVEASKWQKEQEGGGEKK